MGGVGNFLERISYLNDKQGCSASLDCSRRGSIARVGEVVRMWDAASRKVYMELAVRKLEGHGTSRSCMPKDIKVRRGELYLFEN